MSTPKQLYLQVIDRPAPAFTRQQALSTITSCVGLLVTLGILPAVNHDAVLTGANLVISALFVLWGAAHTIIALYASQHTTPTEDPRDNAGNALVPAASSSAIVSIPNVTPPSLIDEGQTAFPSSTDLSLLPSEPTPVEAGGVD